MSVAASGIKKMSARSPRSPEGRSRSLVKPTNTAGKGVVMDSVVKNGLVANAVVGETKDVVAETTKLVDGCSELVDSVGNFGENATRLVDEGIEKVNALKYTKIKSEYKLKAVFDDVHKVAQQSFVFVNKVDVIFYYGKRMQRVKEAVKRGDTEPLKQFLELLAKNIAKAEQEYIIFVEAFKTASKACICGAEFCKRKSEEAKTKKKATRAIGGTASAGVLAAGVGTGVALSIAAGLVTAGIGTIVGLSLTAAGAVAGGSAIAAGTGIATHCIASDFLSAQKSLSELTSSFDEMWRVTQSMRNEVSNVRLHVEQLNDSVCDAEFSRANDHDKQSIVEVLDLMEEKFTNYYNVSHSCQEKLKGKTATLQSCLDDM